MAYMKKSRVSGDNISANFFGFSAKFQAENAKSICTQPSPEVAPSKMEVAPSQMEVAPFQMEVAPFFVDFHHFLSIFTIFYRFSRFTHFCRDLHFVAIYALFPQFFLAKIAFSATSHVFCMYAKEEGIHHKMQKTKHQNV